jgi:hypothetical protein
MYLDTRTLYSLYTVYQRCYGNTGCVIQKKLHFMENGSELAAPLGANQYTVNPVI